MAELTTGAESTVVLVHHFSIKNITVQIPTVNKVTTICQIPYFTLRKARGAKAAGDSSLGHWGRRRDRTSAAGEALKTAERAPIV